MSRSPRTALAGAALLVASAPGLRAQDIALDSAQARWRITGELSDSDAGDLGLVGVHLDLLEPFRDLPEVFVGVGGYGAATGDRGGLFVGGVTAGWRREVWEDWNLELGLFGGGGGGGGNAEFSGLFLRPYVALERQLGLVALRLEAAHVDTPNGEVEDTHVALGVTLPAELLEGRASGRSGFIPERAIEKRTIRARAVALRLDPTDDARRRSGGELEEVELLGVGVDYFLGERLFFPLEAHGAVGGGVDGFAMGMAGLGAAFPLVEDRVWFELKGLVGAGGGGDVDTGGGLGWRAGAALELRLDRAWAVALEGGWMDFPDGEFESAVLGLGIERRVTSPELSLDYPRSRLLREGLSSEEVEVGRTRVSLQHKFYSPSGDARKKDGSEYDAAISLVGVAIEEPLSDWLAITGRAFGAWGGNVGGYAEGLFGAKAELRPLEDWRHVFFATGEVGAGGGGGADVGSGLLFQVGGGYRFEWTDRASVSFEVGHMEADEGTFGGEAYTFGLLWNLNRARYR